MRKCKHTAFAHPALLIVARESASRETAVLLARAPPVTAAADTRPPKRLRTNKKECVNNMACVAVQKSRQGSEACETFPGLRKSREKERDGRLLSFQKATCE
jgi:hypothetical protein